MKYIITGYYDKQNYGDDLFKQVALQLSDKMKESNRVDSKRSRLFMVVPGFV